VCSKLTIIPNLISDILSTTPNTTERHEVASRVNAKEDQTIRQSNQLTAKTKRLSEIASTKALARRSQKRNSTAQAPETMS
jgi:hypothetical protein